MADFYIRENDRRESLVATLKDASGVAVDLSSGVSGVTFNMRSKKTNAVKIAGAAASITTAASGIVTYAWEAGDTDTPGIYYGEFEVAFSTGASPLTFPNRGDIVIEVTAENE